MYIYIDIHTEYAFCNIRSMVVKGYPISSLQRMYYTADHRILLSLGLCSYIVLKLELEKTAWNLFFSENETSAISA